MWLTVNSALIHSTIQLTTPSGKIEIYSSQLAEIKATWELAADDVIDPLPIYSAGFGKLWRPCYG